MAEPDEEGAWWRGTESLAVAVLAGVVAFSFAPLVLAPFVAGGEFLGFGLAYLLTSLVAPIGVTALLFWFQRRQRAIDRRHGMIED